MSSFAADRCSSFMNDLQHGFDYDQELQELRNYFSFSHQSFFQIFDYCKMLDDKKVSDRYSEPMVWIGIYIAIASVFCTLAMVADFFHGLRSKKLWYPCKYFSLNAASITVITVAMKLPVDLNSEMTSEVNHTEVESLGFMCMMMANLMPSLASMDNKTLLANVTGLSILVIAVIVNICIQINTGAIYGRNAFFAYILTAMMALLLLLMLSSSLAIPTSKEILESKYQAACLADQRPQDIQMSTTEKLRQRVRRYWVMAETGSPQFVMVSNHVSIAFGVICVVIWVISFSMLTISPLSVSHLRYIIRFSKEANTSPYKWSTIIIFSIQFYGSLLGMIVPVARFILVFTVKIYPNWNWNYFMFSKVEEYWTQKLHEWKQRPLLCSFISRRLINLINNSKNIILSFCIGFQKMIVVSCKVIWLVSSISVVNCFYWWTLLKAKCFTPPITLRTDDIDEDLRNYVLQIDNEMKIFEILNRISSSMNNFILMAEKKQNNYLFELLENSTDFKGVEIFDSDHVQPLLTAELVNSWSLPIVTLTCISVALPDIPKDTVEKLFKGVDEGLSYTHLVEECLNSAREYVNIRKTTRTLWYEVGHKYKWLDNPLAKNVFEGKTAIEIVEWFSDRATQIVTEIMQSSNGELAENPPHKLIAANSMYRITQTILLRYQSNAEPVTQMQLFAHLNGMIGDIFCACFTNIPRVITMKCHESVIEKREASVRDAAMLFGKTVNIIERVETLELPNIDEDKMAYIDEWRLYMKQSIP